MIATANPGVRDAMETVVGTKRVVPDQPDRTLTSIQERSEPKVAPTKLIAALSPKIIRNTRLPLQPTARKIPSSFVRSTTDISIVLRMLAKESRTTITVIAQADAPP